MEKIDKIYKIWYSENVINSKLTNDIKSGMKNKKRSENYAMNKIDTQKVSEMVKSINSMRENELARIVQILGNMTPEEFTLFKALLEAESRARNAESEDKSFESTDERSLEKIIVKHLRTIGVSANILGYNYLKSAIEFYIEAEKLPSVTKELYPYIAKKHNTTSSKVERCIRHAIIGVFERKGCICMVQEYFGNTVNLNTGKLTNSEFIAGVAEYIKLAEGL